jgi:hypothetical protein
LTHLCRFAGNSPKDRYDVLGLFEDGGSSDPSDPLGHADFENTESCPFDFTLEDKWPTGPGYQPWRHFRDLPDSEADVREAIGACDAEMYERAMHRGQDYFSHWAKGYRFAPWEPWLPCGGWGHLCDMDPPVNPDYDANAWAEANDWTVIFINEWHRDCCKACDSCAWVQRLSGPCDPRDVFP